MPTTVTIYTGPIWDIGLLVAGALVAYWGIRKAIRLFNRS